MHPQTPAAYAASFTQRATGAATLTSTADRPLLPPRQHATLAPRISGPSRMNSGGHVNLADACPRFFWSKVEPFIGDALGYLKRTVEGR